MSVKVNIYNQDGESIDQRELPAGIFEVEPKIELVQQARVTQMANERHVLSHTKGRSEVRGGGKKPWRQKGTGNARHGSIRSPIWIGGGITFGPSKWRNFSKKINKKMRRKAIFMVLTDKVKNSSLLILDKIELEDFKTKKMKEILNRLEGILSAEKSKKNKKSLLLVSDRPDEKVKYSARNLEGVKVLSVDNLNILDLLKYKQVVITSASLDKLEARYQ